MTIEITQMEKRSGWPVLELACMTFSAVCYFICSLISFSLHMVGISYFMLVLSAACSWRVVSILLTRSNQP